MVSIHTNKHKHITVYTLYISPRDTASLYYAILDTGITNCLKHITDTQNSIPTGDVNAN